ncbi:hypothetical protein JC796_03805 [Delftia acidovorans]|uniref:hypothetical protein n=1 Tax=Delftia acidovorans TaxID=80866 RepID=UPI0018E70813|nr:hypothetical protein [Delftia acidovorans]MBJ2139845.1 hypothetical protein [Delftia acidovorans]
MAARIISTFLPPLPTPSGEPMALLMAFDTLVDQKSVVVGITVGKVEGNDLDKIRVSAVGQAIIDRVGVHIDANYPNATVVIAGVAQVPGAKERVRKILAQAPEHSAVFVICANDKVYDAAFPALGVDFKSANLSQQ